MFTVVKLGASGAVGGVISDQVIVGNVLVLAKLENSFAAA